MVCGARGRTMVTAVAAGACGVLALAPVAPASAAARPVPRTYAGYVKSVQDGDTFTMQLAGTSQRWQFRSPEINAPESKDPVTGRPECQANAARTFLLNRLMRRTTSPVTHRAVYVPRYAKALTTNAAERSLGRHVGQPFYAVRTGSSYAFRSATRDLTRAGLAMWMPKKYLVGESDAGSRHAWYDVWYAWGKKVGLFNPTGCGSDQPSVRLQGWLDWDSGTRSKLAGEAIVFRNTSRSTVSMRGWSLRSGQPENYRPTYRFPSTLRLAPGDVVRMHFGSGATSVRRVRTLGTAAARTGSSLGAFAPGTTYRQWDVYMGSRQGVGLSDPMNSRTSSWAQFYLRDRVQNVRAIAATPCYGIGACTDRRKGAFALASVGAASVDLVATRAVDTTGLYVVYKPYSWAWAQPVPANLRLRAGERLRIHPGGGAASTDARGVTHVYLGLGSAYRGSLRGWVGVRSSTDERIGCWSRGAACPGWLR